MGIQVVVDEAGNPVSVVVPLAEWEALLARMLSFDPEDESLRYPSWTPAKRKRFLESLSTEEHPRKEKQQGKESRILQGAREALAIARGEIPLAANELGSDADPTVLWKVEAIKALPGYRLEVTFADGLHGVVDLSHIPHTGVFAVWDEPGYFEKASIDPETWTVCWPNGEDVAPDYMYDEVKQQQGESE